MPCSQYEALFVSAAHSEADIDATLAAARVALDDKKKIHRRGRRGSQGRPESANSCRVVT